MAMGWSQRGGTEPQSFVLYPVTLTSLAPCFCSLQETEEEDEEDDEAEDGSPSDGDDAEEGDDEDQGEEDVEVGPLACP